MQEQRRRRTASKLGLAAALAIAWAPILVAAAPSITILTDSGAYVAGDTIAVGLSTDNPGPGMAVDVYIGLITPYSGLVMCGPGGWTGAFVPWLSGIYHPGHWGLPPTVLASFPVPCAIPPIDALGNYWFASVLAQAGTYTPTCDVSFAPFVVADSGTSDLYVNGDTGSDSNDGSEAFPFKTITHALSTALGSPGNPITIHVAATTYSAGTNGETFPLAMKSWVSLLGEDRDATVLDAGNAAYHVIYCDAVSNLTIEGFTITGGYASNTGHLHPGGSGGGIYLNDSSPVIQNNVITGNVANWYGGGICCFFMSSPTIQHNTISSNWAKYEGGGGISCLDNSSPTIVNNLILDNWLTGDFEGGGGLDCRIISSPTVRNNTFVGNEVDMGGDGIYCEVTSTPTITDCIFWGNGDEWGHDDLYDCVASYCCIEDADAGVGNIHDDPIFVTGPFGDYYLDPTSLCLNVGSQSSAAAGLDDRTTQPDSTPDAGTVDMGYHYPLFEGYDPVAYIDSISPNPAWQCENEIIFIGHASYTEGTITTYEWRSDIDGVLCTDTEFRIEGLDISLGEHEISFRAQTSTGEWSEPDTEVLVVNPGSRLYVDGASGDDTNAGSEAHPFRTITHALEVAGGDATDKCPITVFVASGTYAGSTNGESYPLVMRSYVSIVGESSKNTILDAQRKAHHVIYCDSVDHLSIRDFRITGGRAAGSTQPDMFGAGIFSSKSSPIVMANEIVANEAAGPMGKGGGICCLGGEPLIVSNMIAGNTADVLLGFGGGLYCENCSPTISTNTFFENTAAMGFGGAISCYDASPAIVDNAFTGNEAGSGGAIGCASTGSPAIARNAITENSATSGGGLTCSGATAPIISENEITLNIAETGGGIYCDGASPELDDNAISENEATTGAGIYCCAGSSLTMRYNQIERNTASENGGGMACAQSSPEIKYSNFVENSAVLGGGGIYCFDNSSAVIEGCALYMNQVSDDTSYGGGICCYGASSTVISGNTLNNNRAMGFSGCGGGIACRSSQVTIQHNSILYSLGDGRGSVGGGIYVSGVEPVTIHNNLIAGGFTRFIGGGIGCAHFSCPTISNNTIVDNWAYHGGGIAYPSGDPLRGAATARSGDATIINCILWDNNDDLDNCSATYCCISDMDAGAGNIHSDPLFQTGPYGDYYLSAIAAGQAVDSDCIDAGSMTAAEAGLDDRTTQTDGSPDTGTVDMGYHYIAPPGR